MKLLTKVVVLIACIGLFPVFGCVNNPSMGYSSQSLYPTEFRSVAIPIFKNSTMSRNMEFMLTDAVIKHVQSRTPYRIVDETYADTLLTGTIKSVQLRTLNQSRTTGLDNEMLMEVTIDFEWLNLGTGGRIVAKENFTCDALFIPSRPSSEPLEMGQFAVVQQLAGDIVDQMQATW